MNATPSAEAAVPARLVRFGVFEIDLQANELRKQGRKLRLQEQPCQILKILLARPGEVITREEFRNQLWPSDTFVDFDHSLNTAIMRLREVLGDSSDNPVFIETMPRRGYRFIAPVDRSPAQSASDEAVVIPFAGSAASSAAGPAVNVSADASALANAVPARFPSRVAVWGALAVLLVMVGLGIAAAFQYAKRPPATPAKFEQVRSLVVLPLENLSEARDQDYFADGMTDELIASLAKVRNLRVISRTSAMEYKGTHKPLSQIAKELNVDAVVEGTVLRSADRVRITAELVQISTDRNLWAETYESPLGDVLSLQRRVASAIVDQIRVEVTPEEKQQLVSTHPVNAEAYEDYLKGRYYWNKRSEESLTKAIDYFQLAINKEPQYALAYAGMADCYGIIGAAIVGTVPAKDVAPKAEAAAMKALELDPRLAEAQNALATVKFNYDWDWTEAEAGFKRAIDLNPSYATAHQRYSLYLMAMGRTQESVAEINRARSLDPLSLSMNFSLGWRLYMARQYDQAINQLRNTIEMDPTFALAHLVLGQAYEQKGDYASAIAEIQTAKVLSHNSPPMIAALGRIYAVSGKKADAQRVIDELQTRLKHQYVSPFYIAIIYAGLGENTQAMLWLDKAYKDRSNNVVFLKVDPELDSLHSNAQYLEMLRQIGLQARATTAAEATAEAAAVIQINGAA